MVADTGAHSVVIIDFNFARIEKDAFFKSCGRQERIGLINLFLQTDSPRLDVPTEKWCHTHAQEDMFFGIYIPSETFGDFDAQLDAAMEAKRAGDSSQVDAFTKLFERS
jgi:hypothetical protein